MKQDVEPTAKLIMHQVQVGQPAYPAGVSVKGEFEVEGVAWELKKYWWRRNQWVSKPKTFKKQVVIPLNRKEVENLIGEWTTEWNTFENWREVIINKAAARKEYDDQFEKYAKCFAEIFPEETYEARMEEWKNRRK